MTSQLDALVDRRILTLYGEVNEETARSLIERLLFLYGEHEGVEMQQVSEEPPLYSPMVEFRPIKLVISTYGGSVDEALAIYDVMRMIRDDCEIHTYGVGKVQSAGTLILASGTKGNRRMGKNCQLMIHNLSAGLEGNFIDLEERLEYLRSLDKQWGECMITETKFTQKKLEKILKKKSDVYIGPEEALKLGIVDEVI